MSKKQEQTYKPTADEIQCSYICHKNDLAYVIQPIQYTKKYTYVNKYRLITTGTMKNTEL